MFELINPESADSSVKGLLDATQRQLGRVPNLYRAMANSPKALEAYLAFRGALQGGLLDSKMNERIALLVAQMNACDYCIAAHYFRGQKIGLSVQELQDTRNGFSNTPKIHAALTFIRDVVNGRGVVDESSRTMLITSGWSEAEIGEIVAHIALNVFSNYFKQIADPLLDFPAAPELAS
ncbi:MAG: carboxymuconolactone decarboxylase family protein [Burkholderiales bacterium]|nr:carboxymuconolactone decarboxylase family protein [Burkholderiales bacterium]